jgi:hypothetical protein
MIESEIDDASSSIASSLEGWRLTRASWQLTRASSAKLTTRMTFSVYSPCTIVPPRHCCSKSCARSSGARARPPKRTIDGFSVEYKFSKVSPLVRLLHKSDYLEYFSEFMPVVFKCGFRPRKTWDRLVEISATVSES